MKNSGQDIQANHDGDKPEPEFNGFFDHVSCLLA
jgi:hypothetical protein